MVREFDPDLPEPPQPELPGQDESDWLYDSARDYLDQVQYFKQAQK